MKHALNFLLAGLAYLSTGYALADIANTIERIKPSIVVVGTYKKTNSPQFVLRGTGFVITNGNLVATNAHVVPEAGDPDAPVLVIQARTASGETQVRRAVLVSRDRNHDLAVLRIEGTALPALKIGSSDTVREGQMIAFTGFPIGGALGFSPVTHRGMISSITPIVLPGGNAQQLNEKVIRRIKKGAFNIFQLDATAYPGNSGSPVFDQESGEVIGIINMVFVKGTKESALSQPSGISYAIPASYLLEGLANQ
ncbi:MAG: serine protease [Betaproteobacteria bacterium HGW-Betaproteobacteria-10]|nr:MAG: serine protease [Betaproteobacteria bacterium HGW-Betaproteobacteria-10]